MSEYQTHHYSNFSDYTVSVNYDWRLYPYDIRASIAHAKMLATQNVITLEDSKSIIEGLQVIESEISESTFDWQE